MKKTLLSCIALLMLLTACTVKASKDDYNLASVSLASGTDDRGKYLEMQLVVQNMKNEPVDDVFIEIYAYKLDNPEKILIHTYKYNFMRKEIETLVVDLLPALENAGFSRDDYFADERVASFECRITDELDTRIY